MIPDSFTGLAAEFNATAQKFVSGDTVTTPMLLAKYSALLNYKAKCDADKIELATTLLECGLKVLKKAAQEPQSGGRFTPGEVNYPVAARGIADAIFGRLSASDSIGALPAGAAEDLADVALSLIRKAEGLTFAQFSGGDKDGYRNNVTALAEMTLEYAARFNVAHVPPDVTTSQNISPAKRITLKKEGPAA